MRAEIYPAGATSNSGVPPRMTTTSEQKVEVKEKLLKYCKDNSQTQVEAVIHWTNKDATLWRFACLVEHINVGGRVQDFYSSPRHQEFTLGGAELVLDHARDLAELIHEIGSIAKKGQL